MVSEQDRQRAEELIASAQHHARQRQYDTAASELRAAINLDDGRAELHYWLGQVLVNQGQSDAAIPCFRRTVELAPRKQPEVYLALAEALVQVGKQEEAIAPLRIAKEVANEAANYGLAAKAVALLAKLTAQDEESNSVDAHSATVASGNASSSSYRPNTVIRDAHGRWPASNTPDYGKGLVTAFQALAVVVVLIFVLPSMIANWTRSSSTGSSGSPPPLAQPSQPAGTTLVSPPTQELVVCSTCKGAGRFLCLFCNGTGVCSVCKGSGRSIVKNEFGYYKDCDACRGSGRCVGFLGSEHWDGYRTCGECNGTGRVTLAKAAELRRQDEEAAHATLRKDPSDPFYSENKDLSRLPMR